MTLIVRSIGNTTSEKFNVVSATALDLLKYRHDVELSRNGFVKCIDEVCVKNDFTWTFYVDDEIVLSSVDKYYPKDGEIIELKFGDER